MKKLQSKENIAKIITILESKYKDAKCGLNYTSALQLTIALILAAQCTDNMVNKIIPILFTKYDTIEKLANAKVTDIEKIIKPCGFYRNKAKNISLTSKKILEDFGGNVPCTMKELTSLYGVGRKSANIILQECFNIVEGIAVDTHVSRTTYRMGFTKSNVPLVQEQELVLKIDKKYFSKINHILVYHGRAVCQSRNPKCDICPVNLYCFKRDVKVK